MSTADCLSRSIEFSFHAEKRKLINMDVLIAAIEVHQADALEKINHRLPLIEEKIKHWLDQFRVKRLDDVIKVSDKKPDNDSTCTEDNPTAQKDHLMDESEVVPPTIEEKLRSWLQRVRSKQSNNGCDDISDNNNDGGDGNDLYKEGLHKEKDVTSAVESNPDQDGSYCIIYTTAEDNRTDVISVDDDIHVTNSPLDTNGNIETEFHFGDMMDTGHDPDLVDAVDFGLSSGSYDSATATHEDSENASRRSSVLASLFSSNEVASDGTSKQKRSSIRLSVLPSLFTEKEDNPTMSHILLDPDSPNGTCLRRSSPEWITKEWERHYFQQRKSLKCSDDEFDLVSFPPKLQISISLDDFDDVVEARSQPISREEFQTMLDADGRLVDEHKFRQAVFRGGVDPKIRKEVWQFLFCLYPCHSTAREREILRADYYTKYRALKSRWKKLLREDPGEGRDLIHPAYLEKTPLDHSDPCCHLRESSSPLATNQEGCLDSCDHWESTTNFDCNLTSQCVESCGKTGAECIGLDNPPHSDICCHSAEQECIDNSQDTDICCHLAESRCSVNQQDGLPGRLRLEGSVSEDVCSGQADSTATDNQSNENIDSGCLKTAICSSDNGPQGHLYPRLPSISDMDKCFNNVPNVLNLTGCDGNVSLDIETCNEENPDTLMVNCPSSPMPGTCPLDNFPIPSSFPSPDVREQLKFMEIQANVYAGRQPVDMEELKSCVRIIDKDVPRTDRDCAFFQGQCNPNLQVLRDVLITYSGFHPDTGYAQGMNDILSQFLEVFLSEVEAYWCFTNYMERIKKDFSEDGLVEKLNVVKQLLIEVDPDLWMFIEQLGLGDMTFCHRWMLLCFKREFPREAALKCFEVLSSYHLELTSMEAEIMIDKERRRDFETLEGKNRLVDGDVANPDYTFAVFMCVTIMIEHRKALFQCNDSADVIEYICGLTNHLELDTLLAKSQVLFYRYCQKSINDCFHVLNVPSPKDMEKSPQPKKKS